MGIPESTVLKIKEMADIVEVVSAYLPLKQSGKSFKARCPFHEERTPSFMVSPERQTYHCFGCGAGGDVYTFLMAYEKLDFPTAVRTLADRVGIEVEEEKPGPERQSIPLVDLARRFFARCLRETRAGKPALDYLHGRGITDESIRKFDLGYAPSSGTGLVELARKKKLSLTSMEEAGLLIGRASGHRDRFRHRLMFPIFDERGRTVGFGGRVLGDDGPKYLNSPEGPLFSKGRLLYGAHLARDAIRKTRRSVVVEGYTDVILAHQEDRPSTVGCLGTAFTPHQATILRRYAPEVVLVYDPDSAGATASERGLDVLLARGLQVRVAHLPPGKDPFDFLKEKGGEAFEKLVDGAEDFFEFKLRVARGRHDLATAAGEAAAARELVGTIDKVYDPIQKEVLFRRAAQTLGIHEEALKAAVGGKIPPRPAAVKAPSSGDRLERDLIELLVHRPDLGESVMEIFPPEMFGEKHRPIAKGLYNHIRRGGDVDVPALLVELREEEYCRVLVAAQDGAPGKDHERWWSDVQQKLRLDALDARLKQLKVDMEGADDSESRRLFEEYASCLKERERIRG